MRHRVRHIVLVSSLYDSFILSEDGQINDALGRQFERALIIRALARTGGRRIEAATLLGMGRNTITRKIQELGIEDEPDPEA